VITKVVTDAMKAGTAECMLPQIRSDCIYDQGVYESQSSFAPYPLLPAEVKTLCTTMAGELNDLLKGDPQILDKLDVPTNLTVAIEEVQSEAPGTSKDTDPHKSVEAEAAVPTATGSEAAETEVTTPEDSAKVEEPSGEDKTAENQETSPDTLAD
jgi:hypothetical protein